jgi:hypothetical protein
MVIKLQADQDRWKNVTNERTLARLLSVWLMKFIHEAIISRQEIPLFQLMYSDR